MATVVAKLDGFGLVALAFEPIFWPKWAPDVGLKTRKLPPKGDQIAPTSDLPPNLEGEEDILHLVEGGRAAIPVNSIIQIIGENKFWDIPLGNPVVEAAIHLSYAACEEAAIIVALADYKSKFLSSEARKTEHMGSNGGTYSPIKEKSLNARDYEPGWRIIPVLWVNDLGIRVHFQI